MNNGKEPFRVCFLSSKPVNCKAFELMKTEHKEITIIPLNLEYELNHLIDSYIVKYGNRPNVLYCNIIGYLKLKTLSYYFSCSTTVSKYKDLDVMFVPELEKEFLAFCTTSEDYSNFI